MSAQSETRRIGGRKPRVVISAASLERFEGLAEDAMARQPDLAKRLIDELARARIVSDAKLPDNVVAMGRPATYREEPTAQEKTVTAVSPEEADIAQGRMSVFTPIGIALLGLAEGASFQWEA
ncbi:nucleoside diphosphate kinase regulator [Tritonibacter mobilis]|uniref:nucleoside diphosphate kinase regulator n=1 Tax=Tritonibacter mobilis TaxID=379347 RepID=UPI0014029647|nr:nucleoside diphosphate kinase regulator [Tritonibacter mobilis]NHM19860.1 nucleoside diphosphate kinase regulator [Tritonibacter mobilis]NHM24041.1 nucleoside diphosphate kinase regulator [Tritonibacter mobilis]